MHHVDMCTQVVVILSLTRLPNTQMMKCRTLNDNVPFDSQWSECCTFERHVLSASSAQLCMGVSPVLASVLDHATELSRHGPPLHDGKSPGSFPRFAQFSQVVISDVVTCKLFT